MKNIDTYFINIALNEAKKAAKKGEVPIGAVIVKDGKIISRGHNKKESSKKATAHAEIIAIEKASKKLGDWRLNGCILYVTCEPCIMCAGAIYQSRISKVVYGCPDKRWGAFGSIIDIRKCKELNHKVVVVDGILENECSKILVDFFKLNRKS